MLRNLQDNFKHFNIQIIVVPEGEEQEQKVELIWTNNEWKFSNLAKEIDFQGVQEAQRVPKNVRPQEAHTKAHHNYIYQDSR